MSTSDQAEATQEPLHVAFLALLPKIERHGQVHFRHLRCPHRKADAVAEVVALAWKWYQRLAEVGKDAADFPSALAIYATRAVRSGRRLCGQEHAKDVLSTTAQSRHGFNVHLLSGASSHLQEALSDNTQTPVDEQAAFRVDFPAWKNGWPERDRRLIDDLMLGERTCDVSAKYGLSPGRVSQLRRDFCEDWARYCG